MHLGPRQRPTGGVSGQLLSFRRAMGWDVVHSAGPRARRALLRGARAFPRGSRARSATLRVRVQLGRDEELSSPKTARSGRYFDANDDSFGSLNGRRDGDPASSVEVWRGKGATAGGARPQAQHQANICAGCTQRALHQRSRDVGECSHHAGTGLRLLSTYLHAECLITTIDDGTDRLRERECAGHSRRTTATATSSFQTFYSKRSLQGCRRARTATSPRRCSRV